MQIIFTVSLHYHSSHPSSSMLYEIPSDMKNDTNNTAKTYSTKKKDEWSKEGNVAKEGLQKCKEEKMGIKERK